MKRFDELNAYHEPNSSSTLKGLTENNVITTLRLDQGFGGFKEQ